MPFNRRELQSQGTTRGPVRTSRSRILYYRGAARRQTMRRMRQTASRRPLDNTPAEFARSGRPAHTCNVSHRHCLTMQLVRMKRGRFRGPSIAFVRPARLAIKRVPLLQQARRHLMHSRPKSCTVAVHTDHLLLWVVLNAATTQYLNVKLPWCHLLQLSLRVLQYVVVVSCCCTPPNEQLAFTAVLAVCKPQQHILEHTLINVYLWDLITHPCSAAAAVATAAGVMFAGAIITAAAIAVSVLTQPACDQPVRQRVVAGYEESLWCCCLSILQCLLQPVPEGAAQGLQKQ